MYVQGNSFRWIAEQIGVSKSAVKKYIDEARAEWREDNSKLIGDHIEDLLAELNIVKVNAWRSYSRSCEDALEETIDEGEDTRGAYKSRKVKTYLQAGDPRFLDLVLKCHQQKCKILGVEAPTRIEDVTPRRVIEIEVKTPDDIQTVQSLLERVENASPG